ncbi:SDR family NAD(P)-dependent oxidoreductase [Nakamurella endophytica]|uniref:3-oxoacyl-ACP reductase n=1 Tax=Nakamurella endophytica TaxID=1748367 RepID=A0A917T2A0_9ACTN|nr:SDR family oxidoreductase [Nakamurella endophytica]GGM08223.1 3-oxoacyl-ACP reductase [Nakamurella endophytica]
MRPLADRVVLITGGGSGLGRATALRLARGGAVPVVADVDTDGAQETVAQVERAGGRAEWTRLDVTDSADADRVVAQVHSRHGDRFDGLVNNAGTDRGAGVVDVTDEQWNQVVAVNQSGPLFVTRAFLRAVGAGSRTAEREFPADVVNVISISAISVGADAAAYNSSKAALAMLTQVMQREAHEYRWPARIHGLMPSAMNTPMMEQWHLSDEVMMAPDTVASAVEFVLTLPPDTFVQNLVINSRREPGWPR